MKTLVCQLNLGRTRTAGYTLYNHETMAFDEMTPREVKYLIKDKQVNGLKLNKDEEIELDVEGFNAFNIPVKSGVGNYSLLKPTSGIANYEMYSLTKVFDTDEGLVYEIVSTRCARLPVYESKIRDLYEHKCIIGLWIDDRGMIRFADGVDFEDITAEGLAEKANESISKMKERAESKANETENEVTVDLENDLSAEFEDADEDFINSVFNGHAEEPKTLEVPNMPDMVMADPNEPITVDETIPDGVVIKEYSPVTFEDDNNSSENSGAEVKENKTKAKKYSTSKSKKKGE